MANTIPVPPPQDGFGDELEGRKRLPTKKKRKEPTEEERFAEGRGAQKAKKRESGRTWRDFTNDEDGEEGPEAAEPAEATPPADAPDGGDDKE